MQKPNIYFQLVQVHVDIKNSPIGNNCLSLETGPGIVLEVNNRDAKGASWSAHLIGCFVPFLFINIEFKD